MKHLFVLVALLFSVHMARSAPVTGAVVQTWHYDPQTNMVTLQIVNASHKDITAYNISIKETYADGDVDNHELMCDFVGRIKFLQDIKGSPEEARIRKELGDGLFHPGEVRKELVGVQPGLQDFQAVVDVVAYADQSSEASNNDGLQRLVDHRKVDVASRQIANEIIKAALADPNDANPAATAAAKIQDRITVWEAQPHTTLDLETGTLQGVVQELKEISLHSNNKRDALNQYLAKSEQGIATLSPHMSYRRTQVLINAVTGEVGIRRGLVRSRTVILAARRNRM
jgi:hypothetical protein